MKYGLIFDVDGVIADTESLSSRVTAAVMKELFGITGIAHEDFNPGRGRGAEAYLRAAASAHGVDLSSEQVLEAESRRERAMLEDIRTNPLPPYPGVLHLIGEALKSDDFTMAIATSSTRNKSQAVLRATGVPFERMAYVTGSDVRNKKPDPELFLTAASRIDTLPERCLVIEDAPSGIQAAKNAGCLCVAVTNSFTSDYLNEADMIIDSLDSLNLDKIRNIINDKH